jgi:hypothetical protein
LGSRFFITAVLNTFALKMSCMGVEAKLSGGLMGAQLVTAEIAAMRAEELVDVERLRPGDAAELPFTELFVFTGTDVLTGPFPCCVS